RPGLIPQKSTRSPYAITSGNVFPAASSNSCLVGVRFAMGLHAKGEAFRKKAVAYFSRRSGFALLPLSLPPHQDTAHQLRQQRQTGQRHDHLARNAKDIACMNDAIGSDDSRTGGSRPRTFRRQRLAAVLIHDDLAASATR